jgi:hypothetical protein
MSTTHALTARWLLLKQAAQYSGLSDRTLRNYAQFGLLTIHRITTRILKGFGVMLIPASEIERICEGGASHP